MKPSSLGAGAFALVVSLGLLAAGRTDARADGASFDGAWTLSPVTEAFTVQQWSAPCGPVPGPGTMMQGAEVMISSQDGELVIAGEARLLRTDQCLDPMTTLAPDTHSRETRSWRTRCVTPSNDPRRAIVNTAFFVAPGDDAISIAETGRYEFTIHDGRCVADVKRAASLSRLVAPPRQPTLPPSAARDVTARAPPRVDCSTPGEPARLEVRPSRKLLRLGEGYAFRAVVLDASGCMTGTPIQWSVGPIVFKDGKTRAGQPAIGPSGKLDVPTTDFGDCSFDVVATAAGKSARAAVEVTSPVNYDALLAQSGLDAKGERDEPSVAVLATAVVGASKARADDGAHQRRGIFIAIVGGLALVLGIIGVVGAQRARRARKAAQAAEERHATKMREYEKQKLEREERHAAHLRAHRESVAVAQQQAAAAAARGVDTGLMFCPSCRREFPSRTMFCPLDANRLVAMVGNEGLVAGPPGGICPTCRRGFNPGVKVCPHDGDELVPSAVGAMATVGLAHRAPSAAPRGKICPTCGGRFDGVAAFCGQDGTQLVLLN